MAEAPAARLCLPTGSTPRPGYRRFAEAGGDLRGATVFLLDEFGLPPSNVGRCDVMLDRDLIGLLPQPPRAVHTIDVQAADLDAEARRYEAAVRDGGLDLAILGLGGNGHLGLNEPGSELDSTTRLVQLTSETSEHAESYGSDAPATWGITMGIDTLLASDEVWLLVTGAHKAEILAQMMNEEVGPHVPGTFLRTHANATVWADEAAAGRL